MQHIRAAVTGNHVIAGAAINRIVSEAGRNRVIAVPAVKDVRAVPAVDHVIAAEAIDHIRPGRAVQRICAGRAVDRRVDRRPGRIKQPVRKLQPFDIGDAVRPVGTRDRGHAARHRDRVGRPVAGKHGRVGSVAAVDRVVAAGTGKRVVVRAAIQGVSTRPAVEYIRPGVAVQGRTKPRDGRNRCLAGARDMQGVG